MSNPRFITAGIPVSLKYSYGLNYVEECHTTQYLSRIPDKKAYVLKENPTYSKPFTAPRVKRDG